MVLQQTDRERLQQRLAGLSPAQRALLERRLLARSRETATDHIPRRTSDEPPPLSFAQRRLWFMDQVDPGSSLFVVARAHRIHGPLDATALQRSLETIVARHAPLRTRFQVVDGEPRQVISGAWRLDLPLIDLRPLAPADREGAVARLLEEHGRQAFDLANDLLLRASLVRLADEEHLLLLAQHHIASDAWSARIFERELAALYPAFCAGEPAPLPDLPTSYADATVWQQERLAGPLLTGQLAYWQERLGDGPPPLDLPTDRPRPAEQVYDGAEQTRRLPRALADRLTALGREEQATLFMVLLAAFDVLLYRLSGHTDVTIGTPTAGRLHPDTEGLLGCFLNTLVLRADLSGQPTFREVLRRVRETALGAYAYQDVPFEKLVEELRVERDPSRSPLFQVLFNLHSGARPRLSLSGLIVEPVPLPIARTAYDLTLTATDAPDALTLQLEYATALFDHATATRWLGHLDTLLEGVIAAPDEPIQALPILSAEEHTTLVERWSQAPAVPDLGEGIQELFEAQAARAPDATAFLEEMDRLTYRGLNERANRLAHLLRERGVAPGTVVGLCLERSLDAMVGVLAIVKAGGIYLPLDPSLPPARLEYMLADSQAALVVTRRALLPALPTADGFTTLLVDDSALERQPASNPPVSRRLNDLAYVTYTSGSTGKPKGVAMDQRAVLNPLAWMWRAYPFAEGEVACAKTGLHFVDSLWDIFGPLLQGVPSVVLSEETVRDPRAMVRLLAEHRVTRLWLVPSLIRALLDTHPDLQDRLPALTLWLSSGEVVPAELLARFRQQLPRARLVNLYGASEVWVATWAALDDDEPWRVSVGRPIDRSEIYLLDEQHLPVPVGVTGELYVGGCLAQGYLNQRDLTAAAFVPHPFAREAGARLYRTGDLARWRPDGSLEVIGRRDHQVKIRGVRIEPGEVSDALNQHPNVRLSVVVPRDRPHGDRVLVAYVEPHSLPGPSDAELRAHLAATLPAAMLPAAFVTLEALPLTPSGKLDRLRLPAPEDVRPTPARTAPADALQATLTAIWERVLDVQPIGPDQDFFELGGHSLLAVRLVTEIETAIGREVPLALLFRAPTVSALADALRDTSEATRHPSLVPLREGGNRLPFFLVHSLSGNVLTYADLAREMDPDQPIYGLEAAGVTGKNEPDDSMEVMAARYVEAIRTVQPHGPYRMGGYCVGGVIAYEMARQLRATGESIALVAILEGYAPRRPGARSARWTPRGILNTLRNLPPWFEDYGQYIVRRGPREILARVLRQGRLARGQVDVRDFVMDMPRLPGASRTVIDANLRAARTYRPGAYDGPLTLFRVRGLSLSYSFDPAMGWGAMSSAPIDVAIVPGVHHNILAQPHVRGLAALLDARLRG